MVVFFIEESNKSRLLNSIEKYEDKIIIHKKLEKLNKRTVNKIIEILDNNNCKKVVLSNCLKQNRDFINLLYSHNIDILCGKRLFKILIENIIYKICIQNQLNPKQCQISITANYLDDGLSILIENLSKKFKMLSIVNNNINTFRQIKEKLYNEDGIIITVTNNKRKALLKSDLIVNFDFPEEVLNKYAIYDNAILINIEESINIHKKRFTGKIINDFKISLLPNSNIALELEKHEYNKYDLKDLVEVYIMGCSEEICNIII